MMLMYFQQKHDTVNNKEEKIKNDNILSLNRVADPSLINIFTFLKS